MEWIGTESAMLQAVTLHPDAGSGRCQFPGCAAPVPARPKGQRGAPRSYCDNADHTAQKALRLRLKDADRAARLTSPPNESKPVTEGIATLAALVDRYEQLRTELAAVADDAADVLADLTDPSAIEREVNEVRRDAEVRIAAAEQARDDAEKACAAMKLRHDRAVELETLAIDAAEEPAHKPKQHKHGSARWSNRQTSASPKPKRTATGSTKRLRPCSRKCAATSTPPVHTEREPKPNATPHASSTKRSPRRTAACAQTSTVTAPITAHRSNGVTLSTRKHWPQRTPRPTRPLVNIEIN